MPYSSTVGGFYNRALDGSLSPEIAKGYVNDRNLEIAHILEDMAEKYKTTPIAISLAILLCQPFAAFPVIAVSRLAQLSELLAADDITLEAEDIALLNAYFQ